MGKSNGKWDIDWRKIGKNMGKVTEPEQGVGTGKSMREGEAASGGVRAVRVSMPQRPTVPRMQAEEGGVATMTREDVHGAAENANGYEYEDFDMDAVVSTEPARVQAAKVTNFAGRNQQEKARPSGGRDTQSGMELLTVDFMLGVAEATESDADNDISMRKMCFNELLRVGARGEIDSRALSVYAVDAEGYYGKDIQRQAMEELAVRTGHSL